MKLSTSSDLPAGTVQQIAEGADRQPVLGLAVGGESAYGAKSDDVVVTTNQTVVPIRRGLSNRDVMVDESEYSASEIRRMLQQLFPTRRLVLSQFTFFNQVGVARATGTTSRRGRRCYRLQDVLSIACVLALKEEGIPLRNIESVPALVQEHASRIFQIGEGVKLMGFGPHASMMYPGESWELSALQPFLQEPNNTLLFWCYDLGALSAKLRTVAQGGVLEQSAQVSRAA